MESLTLPSRPFVWAVALLLCALTTGCDQGALQEPSFQNDLFRSYVALGNSVTAGFQSAGIVDSTQKASYAALIGKQMGTPFELPLLEGPGCPPPVDNIFLSSLSGGTGGGCALRSIPLPAQVHNVAVPGARVSDALSNLAPGSSPNQLTSFILGGRTQLQAATQAHPTFASVWLGNNDVLGGALAGDTTLFTPASQFRTRMISVVEGLVEAGAEQGILLGVANPLYIPNLSPGQAYYAAEPLINQVGPVLASQQPGLSWGGFDVLDSCAPGQAGAMTRVPFAYGVGSLLLTALNGASVELDCAPSSAAPPLLTPAEQAAVTAQVRAYNEIISSLAGENGWAYLNVNPTFQALYAAGAETPDPSDDLVPKFPNPPNPQNPGQSPPTFGQFFSEDGVHPSSAAHRVVANLVIETVNEEYSTQLEPIEAPAVPSP